MTSQTQINNRQKNQSFLSHNLYLCCNAKVPTTFDVSLPTSNNLIKKTFQLVLRLTITPVDWIVHLSQFMSLTARVGVWQC